MAAKLPAVPTATEMEGWDADDCVRLLDDLDVHLGEWRSAVGAVLWKLRRLEPDNESFGRRVASFADRFGVTVATLARWRQAAEERFGLPPAIDRPKIKPQVTRGTSRITREVDPPRSSLPPVETTSRSVHVAEKHQARPTDGVPAWWVDDPQRALAETVKAVADQLGAQVTVKLLQDHQRKLFREPEPPPARPPSVGPCKHPRASLRKITASNGALVSKTCGICGKRL